MISFRELLTATPEKLVNVFYRVKPAPTNEFLVRIDWAATQLQVNHAQLVCSLGFNPNTRDLTDILAVLGFTSFKPLSYRRNELFATDAYNQISIDNVLDIYSQALRDAEFLSALRDSLPRRLQTIEGTIGSSEDPVLGISYRMEVHAVYNGGIVDRNFALQRLAGDIGPYRLLAGETEAIVEAGVLPSSNIFYMDNLLPEEKRVLIERRLIPAAMIRNRLGNDGITEEERAMLQGFL